MAYAPALDLTTLFEVIYILLHPSPFKSSQLASNKQSTIKHFSVLFLPKQSRAPLKLANPCETDGTHRNRLALPMPKSLTPRCLQESAKKMLCFQAALNP